MLAVIALSGCGSAALQGVDTSASAGAPSTAPSGVTATPGSGIAPPELRTRSAKLSDRLEVDALAPTHLSLLALGVSQPVVPVGVASDGQLNVPADAMSVSWYRYGRGLDGPGSTVLAGHVDFADRQGVFWRLDEARTGQVVEVAAGRTTRRYRVSSVRRYPKQELPLTELFDDSGPHKLVLITCGGSFDAQQRSYRDNVVVIASPV